MRHWLIHSALVLGLLFSIPVSAHEARVNPEQRRAIQERLEQTGCLDLVAKAGGGTRGISRGVTRGGTRSVGGLPAAAEQYSSYFSMVIPAELDLPYGHEGDPKSHTFFQKDPYEGAEKMRVQTELGIKWGAEGSPTVVPTWMEFAQNYRAALKARGVDPSKMFVPSLVLYRDLGEVVSPTTQKKTMKREYKFVDPLTEQFPADMSQWKLLNKDVQFNIPFAPIFEAMQQGKFPLLDALHDVSHFVSFLRFPEFSQTVLAQMKKMKTEDVTSGFKGREYWLTEALSLPDPASQQLNHDFLAKNNRSTAVRDVAQIEKELAALPEKDLLDYSYKQAKHFESVLRDVSGGNSNSAEKWFYLSESFGMRAQDLLNEDIERSPAIGSVMNLAKNYFENAPVTLHANPKAITNETAVFMFNTFVGAQKLLALTLKKGKEGSISRSEALKQLAKFTSRTEYLLTEKPFTYQEWAEAFLNAELPKDHPVAKMLTRVFDNETVVNFYLGKGGVRPKKTANPD